MSVAEVRSLDDDDSGSNGRVGETGARAGAERCVDPSAVTTRDTLRGTPIYQLDVR